MAINVKCFGVAPCGTPLYRQMDAPGYEPGITPPKQIILIWDEQEEEVVATTSVESMQEQLEFMEFYWEN